jgi:hypothetical protein
MLNKKKYITWLTLMTICVFSGIFLFVKSRVIWGLKQQFASHYFILKIHAICGLFLIFILGMIYGAHYDYVKKIKHKYSSGRLLLLLVILNIITVAAMYYITVNRKLLVIMHSIITVLMFSWLLMHFIKMKNKR